MLDSVAFRHLPNLRQMHVNGDEYAQDTVLVPRSTGYPLMAVRFVGADGSTLSPVLPVGARQKALPSGALGAHYPGALLRLADVEHAFPAMPMAQILSRAFILAFATFETNQVHPLALGVAFPLVDEAPRHRRHQGRRRHRMASYLTEEVRRAGRTLKQRHVDVEIEPIDAFELQRRVLGQYLGGASCYLHPQDSGRWAPHLATLRPPTPQGDYERGFVRSAEQRPESDSTVHHRGHHMPRRSEAQPR